MAYRPPTFTAVPGSTTSSTSGSYHHRSNSLASTSYSPPSLQTSPDPGTPASTAAATAATVKTKSDKDTPCAYCEKMFTATGVGRHEQNCQARRDQELENAKVRLQQESNAATHRLHAAYETERQKLNAEIAALKVENTAQANDLASQAARLETLQDRYKQAIVENDDLRAANGKLRDGLAAAHVHISNFRTDFKPLNIQGDDQKAQPDRETSLFSEAEDDGGCYISRMSAPHRVHAHPGPHEPQQQQKGTDHASLAHEASQKPLQTQYQSQMQDPNQNQSQGQSPGQSQSRFQGTQTLKRDALDALLSYAPPSPKRSRVDVLTHQDFTDEIRLVGSGNGGVNEDADVASAEGGDGAEEAYLPKHGTQDEMLQRVHDDPTFHLNLGA